MIDAFSRPLRVLHATPAFAPAYSYGGPIRSLEGLVVELARRGVEVRVLTTDADGPRRLAVPSGWHRRGSVPVRYVRRWARPDLTPVLAWCAILEARRADVVHASEVFAASSMAALAAADLVGVPGVLSARGALEPAALAYGPSRKKRAWLAAFGRLLRRATLHATSDAEAASIERVLGAGVRVRVVPNGTDLEPLDGARARKARLRGRITLGALGRLHPIKGLERILGAAAILLERGLDLQVVLAGPAPDPVYAAELRRLADASSVAGRVIFPGELSGEPKLDFLAGCSVLCLPSASENFGNVVVEALAALTPVVAARGTPWSELEDHGAGRWVDRSNESLADAIEPFLRDPALAEAAGERGRALVEARYKWSAVAPRMEAVYREAILHRRSARRFARGQ